MSLTPPALALVVFSAALSSPLAARAQETQVPSAPPAETPRATTPGRLLNQNVRIDVTITLKGEPKPVVKTLTMVAADDRMSKGRASIEIPVSTGGPIQAVNYRTVGVNVDATPDIVDATRVLLRLQWQYSTVYPAQTTDAARPSFGSGSHEAHGIVFESGKPLVITQAADGDSGREYSVEVKATILK